MKRLFLAAAAVLAGCMAMGQTHVRFDFVDFTDQPAAVRSFYLYATPDPGTNGTGRLVTRDRISRTTSSQGSVTVSNVFPGCGYRSELVGSYGVTTNWFSFPADAGLVDAADYVTASTNLAGGLRAYSMAVTDSKLNSTSNSLLSQITSGGVSTNVVVALALAAGQTNEVPASTVTNLEATIAGSAAGSAGSLTSTGSNSWARFYDSAGAAYLTTSNRVTEIQGSVLVTNLVGHVPALLNVRLAPISAAGDGVTDDTAALQAALNQMTNGVGTVYLPAGRYLLSDTLYWPTGSNPSLVTPFGGITRVKGDGPGITVILSTKTDRPALEFPTPVPMSMSIEGLSIIGPNTLGEWGSAAENCKGIIMGGASEDPNLEYFSGQLVRIEDIHVAGFSTGLAISNIWSPVMERMLLASNSVFGVESWWNHYPVLRSCEISGLRGGQQTNFAVAGVVFWGDFTGLQAMLDSTHIFYFSNAVINKGAVACTVLNCQFSRCNTYMDCYDFAGFTWIGGAMSALALWNGSIFTNGAPGAIAMDASCLGLCSIDGAHFEWLDSTRPFFWVRASPTRKYRTPVIRNSTGLPLPVTAVFTDDTSTNYYPVPILNGVNDEWLRMPISEWYSLSGTSAVPVLRGRYGGQASLGFPLLTPGYGAMVMCQQTPIFGARMKFRSCWEVPPQSTNAVKVAFETADFYWDADSTSGNGYLGLTNTTESTTNLVWNETFLNIGTVGKVVTNGFFLRLSRDANSAAREVDGNPQPIYFRGATVKLLAD